MENRNKKPITICIDVYPHYVDIEKCKEALELYDHANRQLYRLKESWRNFHQEE